MTTENQQNSEATNSQAKTNTTETTSTQTQAQSSQTSEQQQQGSSQTTDEKKVAQASEAGAKQDNTASADFSDIKLSDGSLLEAKELEDLKEYAKANNLTGEQVKQLVAREESLLTGYKSKLEDLKTKVVSDWGEQIKNDPELGGEKLETSKKFAQAVIKQFGDAEFINQLEESGFGNHPGLFKLLYNVSKALKLEPQDMVHGKIGGQSSTSTKPIEERFYGSSS